MKTVIKTFFLILTLNLFSYQGIAQETELKENYFPVPIGIINDYGQIFTELERTELSKILYDYDIETTRQIVVITIDSIKPHNDIQKYATDLSNYWGIGNAKKTIIPKFKNGNFMTELKKVLLN